MKKQTKRKTFPKKALPAQREVLFWESKERPKRDDRKSFWGKKNWGEQAQHFSWIAALADFEKRDDPAPLLKLMEPFVPAPVFHHFEDAFERKKLRRVATVGKKLRRPRAPSYTWILSNLNLLSAIDFYHEDRARGISKDEAMLLVTDMFQTFEIKIDLDKFREIFGGRNFNFRSMKKRWLGRKKRSQDR
jgi:hypothetical protein